MKGFGRRIFLIGVITTISRIIGQLMIPSGAQSVLAPSIFVTSGTMPLFFTAYSIIVFSAIAAMYLLVSEGLSGSKIWRGLQYGIACSLIWFVYLLEPLPHAVPLDRITYPLADTASLLVLGALSGKLLSKESTKQWSPQGIRLPFIPMAAITGLFVAGRLFLYHVISIYSSFSEKPWTSIVWSCLSGAVIASVMVWFERHLRSTRRSEKALLLGGLLFGLNLVLFNFFMPLIFDANLVDLFLRTGVDVIAVSLGTLTFELGTSRVQSGAPSMAQMVESDAQGALKQ